MHKNKTIIIAIVMLIVGIAIGKISNHGGRDGRMGNMHQMPNGEMMHDMQNTTGEMTMDKMMMDMNANLVGKTGDEFDKTFLAEMIVHHKGAVDMANLALTNANHQEIKDLAKAIIDAQNKEIADMTAWQAKWFEN